MGGSPGPPIHAAAEKGHRVMTAPPMQWDRALVVFSGQSDQIWLRILRKGFRHCFLVLGSPGGWLYLNPMAHQTQIQVLAVPPHFKLAEWYRNQGLTVVETIPIQPPRRAAPWRPFTCVEAVKRVLGLTSAKILTPWDLYQHLTINGINSLTPPAQTSYP